jgi:hypothetical protein
MSQPQSTRRRTLLLSTVCLLAVVVLSGTARAATFGELTRFGSSSKGELTSERTRAIGVNPTDNSVYVLDEPEEFTQKKEKEPGCEPEPEPEPGECEFAVGPITRHFRLQKFTIGKGGKYAVSAATTFTEVSPESFGAEPKVEGIAVDPAHKRLYLLTVDAREKTLPVDNSEKSSETPAPALEVASTLYAFSTEESGSELVPWNGKGTSPVLVSPETLKAQSPDPGEALLQPSGLTVDPENGEVIILGHVDLKGEAADDIANPDDHYALQRIAKTGTLGERYVDSTNFLKASPPYTPNSPIVTGPAGSEKVYVSYDGLTEIPAEFASSEAPHAVGPSAASEDGIESGLGEELTGAGGGLSAAPPEGGAPDGTIYGVTSVKNEASGGYRYAGIAERSGVDGSEIGWTGGQQPEELEKGVATDACVIEPYTFSVPVAMAVGSGGKIFVLAPEFLLQEEPGGGEPLNHAPKEGVIEFGPEGTGCPTASISSGIEAEANGTKLEPGVSVKAGAHVTLFSHVDQADAAKIEWEYDNETTKEVSKETVAGTEFQNTRAVHIFEQPGTVAVTETIYTDDLASSTPLSAKRSFTVTAKTGSEAPKVTLQPAGQSVTEPATATFKSEASGNPAPTVQWEVSTNKGTTFAPISGKTSDTLTIEDTNVSESGNEYRAVFSNGVSPAATSNPATLNVNAGVKEAPAVTKQPENQAVTEPANATFTAEASGNPVPSVQWEVSTNKGATFAPIAGKTTDTLTIEGTSVSESGNEYRAVFANGIGSPASSDPATLTVTAPAKEAPKVTQQPGNATVTEPAPATFKAEASGTPTPTVQWEVSTNSGATFAADPGKTSDTLTIESTAVSASGDEYRAVFTNSAGKATSSVATLTVGAKPVTPPPPPPPPPGGQVLNNKVEQPPAVPDATIAGASLTVSASGALVIKVTCPSGETSCAGTLTLRTLTAVSARATSSKKKSKAAILTLAGGSFSVVGGQVKAFTLHLSSAARTLLSHSHGLLRARVTVLAHDPTGATHTTETVVTLRAAPKAKKKHG